jgi:hypothetical protein
MGKRMKCAVFVGVFLCALTTACGGSSSSSTPTPTPSPTPTVTSVTVGGSTSFSSINQTSQLTATANLSNGTTQAVTTQATWQSSNTTVATVSASGLVTAVGAGQADLRATYQGVTGSTQAVISIAPLANLTGRWVGTATASTGVGGSMTLNITQSGSTLSGFGTTFFEPTWPTAAVLISGSVSGNSVNLTLADNDGSCLKVFTHSVTAASNSVISGTYTKRGGCSGNTITGTFSVTKQ